MKVSPPYRVFSPSAANSSRLSAAALPLPNKTIRQTRRTVSTTGTWLTRGPACSGTANAVAGGRSAAALLSSLRSYSFLDCSPSKCSLLAATDGEVSNSCTVNVHVIDGAVELGDDDQGRHPLCFLFGRGSGHFLCVYVFLWVFFFFCCCCFCSASAITHLKIPKRTFTTHALPCCSSIVLR